MYKKLLLIVSLCIIGCHSPTVPTTADLDSGIENVIDANIADVIFEEDVVDANVSDVYDTTEDTNDSVCPPDMVLVTPNKSLAITIPTGVKFDPLDFNFNAKDAYKPYCIDKYEWPNVVGGKPTTAVSYTFAADQCKKVGKRLPTHAEWVVACMGENQYTFGYGNSVIRGNCNINKQFINPDWSLMGTHNGIDWPAEVKRLYQADSSGSNTNCFSQWGNDKIYDMIGNATELVSSPQDKYGMVAMGGFWLGVYRNEPTSCLYSNYAHNFNTFLTYEMSFRCLTLPHM